MINREVVPAIGCTEPIAVALCVAKAAETLNQRPQKIQVLLSANILKNAMGVGIPGTDMIGLPIAVALGALIGKSEYQLEVLKDSTPEAVEAGTVRLIGTHKDVVYAETKRLLTDKAAYDAMSNAVNPYGDGQASRRIVEAILHVFAGNEAVPDDFSRSKINLSYIENSFLAIYSFFLSFCVDFPVFPC